MRRNGLLLLVLVITFAWLHGLREWGVWYSGDGNFRLQTDALLHGHWALQRVPNGQRYGWAWGSGSQQAWGVGVPLLRLPLEALAHAVGAFGFPDSITFVLLFALAAAALARTFCQERIFERAALLIVIALCPAFVTLCRTRFEAYEEAVGAAFLWSVLLGALLLQVVQRPRARLLQLLCAAAGVAVWFRPTAIFYGAVAVVIGLRSGWRARLPRHTLAFSSLLFLVGPAVELGLNQLRFGSPFELGYRLNVAYDTVDQFARMFGYPYQREPIGSATRELFSSLFFSRKANGYGFYDAGVVPMQSATLRFREFYFATFSPWMLPAIVLTWCGVLAAFFLRARFKLARSLCADPRIATGAQFSAAAFAAQTIFYLRTQGMTSRYAVDFAVAIAFALGTLLLIGFTWLPRRFSIVLALAALGITAHAISTAWIGQVQSHRRLLTAAQLERELPRPRLSAPPLRSHYQCGDSLEADGVSLNGFAWDQTCLVGPSTKFFLPAPECVQLDIAAARDGEVMGPEGARAVRVRRGLTPMYRLRDEPHGDGRRLSFCAPASAELNPTGIDLVAIGWVEPRLLTRMRPLRLLAITTTSR